MAWVRNPLNLLTVDSDQRLPDFMGWYTLDNLVVPQSNLAPKSSRRVGGHTTLILPSAAAKVDKGLRAGISQVAKRNGNRNDSITLTADQAIVSNPKNSSNQYPTSISVLAGQPYTLGVTAVSAYVNLIPATVALKMFWINASGTVISESGDSQGIVTNYGIKVRNSVTATAPTGATGVVVYFATNHPVILTFPTLAVGTEDLRVGNPTLPGSSTFTPADSFVANENILVGTLLEEQELYLLPEVAGLYPQDVTLAGSGDVPDSLNNLFYHDLNSSSIPWHDGWTNEFGDQIVSNGDILHLPANSEARLYYEEDLQTTTTMGIPVIPFTQYTMKFNEFPTRTSSTFQLKFYDISGTRLLGTTTPPVLGTQVNSTFITPAQCAYVAIKIKAIEETYFEAPSMTQGETVPDPGGNLAKVLCQWDFRSNNLQRISINTQFVSTVLAKYNKSWEFRSDTVLLVNLDSTEFVSDVLGKLTVNNTFLTNNSQKVIKSWEFVSNIGGSVSKTWEFRSSIVQKLAQKLWVFNSDLREKVNTASIFATENLQIVGRQFPEGGVVTAQTLASGILLLPSEPLYRPSKSLIIVSDILQSGGVQKTWEFKSDLRQLVGTKTVRFDTDSNNLIAIRFESRSDLLITIHRTIVFRSDIPPNVPITTTFVFRSDNNAIVSKTLNIISGRYARVPKRVISTRPLREIGVV